MKGRMRVVFGVLLAVVMGGGCGRGGDRSSGTQAGPTARITVSGAWALYPMVVKWAQEYRKIRPDVQIDVSAGGAGKGMTDTLSGAADVGMVSRDVNAAEKEKGAWWVAVVKDAVVPTMNAGNPDAGVLARRGLKKEEFAGIFVRGDVTDWGAVGCMPGPIHVYTRSDACGAAETWAKYFGAKQEDLKGTAVYGDPGVAEAVRKDSMGLGFNNLNFAYDIRSGKPVAGILAVPVDINGNGKIDPEESFYDSHSAFVKAIAAGRYPSPPSRDLNLVCKGLPTKGAVAEFIRWVLTDGQKFVLEGGYIGLPDAKLKEALAALDGK